MNCRLVRKDVKEIQKITMETTGIETVVSK